MKKYQIFFSSENFPFLVVKCSIYLKRRVFVMTVNETSMFESLEFYCIINDER